MTDLLPPSPTLSDPSLALEPAPMPAAATPGGEAARAAARVHAPGGAGTAESSEALQVLREVFGYTRFRG
jgi:hypothetical protein